MSSTNQLLKGVFSETLLKAGKRLTPSAVPIKIRLDRNESAFDVSAELKKTVLDKLEACQWSKYPPPYYNEIEGLIARYSKVKPGQVVPAAGSANIITSLLNYFAINNRQIVIAHPSFSLYEYHCNSYGIPYELWKLNDELEYDNSLLPNLQKYGLVLFASPNNPVGNTISKEQLIDLLQSFPDTIFILDEVYNEFCEDDHTGLLDKYPNLVLLRSFSKTFSAAGLRAGYLIANEQMAINFRKLVLPFVLNILSAKYVESVLKDSKEVARKNENIAATISERDRVREELFKIRKLINSIEVYPSKGNFLLVKFNNSEIYETVNFRLEAKGIKLLDVSGFDQLGNSLRITIGTPEQNSAVLRVFESLC